MQAPNTLVGNGGSYTQGRIAGDFLSIPVNRDRAERCPPKTTATALDG
jgi:hypothetical protein